MCFFPDYWEYTHLNGEQWRILKLKYKELKLQSKDYDIIVEMEKVKQLKPL